MNTHMGLSKPELQKKSGQGQLLRGWAHQHALRFLSDANKSSFPVQFEWFWIFLVIYKGRVQDSELEMQNPNTAIQWARQAAQHTLKVQLHTEGESFTEEPMP